MSDEGFEQDIITLRNYSFISDNCHGTAFEMHSLVQLATREWLKAHKQHEKWKERFVRNLDSALPTGEYENWTTCQALFPHAQAALTQKPTRQDSQKVWATILYKAAWYAEDIGRWDAAEEMLLQALKVRREIFGPDHLDTLTSMANLASTYQRQGRWADAEELEVQVIETRKTKLGPDHPDTLTSMANLACTWKESGRVTEAIRLMEACVQAQRHVLGTDHPYTQSSSSALDQWMQEAEEEQQVDTDEDEDASGTEEIT